MSLLTSGDGKWVTGLVTASIAPTSGRLVLVACAVSPTATTVPTVTGANITFVNSADYIGWNGGGNGLANTYIFTGVSDGTSGALTIGMSDTNGIMGYVVSEFEATAVVQSKTGLSPENNPDQAFTVTLDNALADPANIVVAVPSNNNYATYTSSNGFVLDADSGTNDHTRVSVLSKVNDIAPTVTGSGSYTSTAMIVVELSAGAAPVLPSITSHDDPISLDSTSSYVVSDFDSAITTATISRDGISVSGSSVSNTGATWPALAQGLVVPEFGSGATLTLGDGTDTAESTVEIALPTGYTWNTVGTVAGSLVEGDWGFSLGLESSQDGYITRDADSAIATHNDDGTSTWSTDGTSLVYSWDKNAVVGDDGGLTSITLTNSESGGGGTDKKLTYSKLTGVKLTSTNLEASKL